MNRPSKKTWIVLGAFMVGIGLLDQLTKALAAKYIPYLSTVKVIPGVVHLTYVRNTGAAFSMFEGMRWLFLVLVAVYFAAMGLLICKGVLSKPFELWCLAAIGGGALGNAVDRIVSGQVIDMIEPEFINFAVFNVADCFITCGAIALAVYLLFFDKGSEKKTSKEAG